MVTHANRREKQVIIIIYFTDIIEIAVYHYTYYYVAPQYLKSSNVLLVRFNDIFQTYLNIIYNATYTESI